MPPFYSESFVGIFFYDIYNYFKIEFDRNLNIEAHSVRQFFFLHFPRFKIVYYSVGNTINILNTCY